MKLNQSLLIILSLLLFACNNQQPSNTTTSNEKPNIIYILADDLGYGDLGCYGQQKIETPNIDALAKEGMKFTQHYAGSPVCAPSRCVLLTGKHSGNAYIRGNGEWKERGDVWNYIAMINDSTLEGQRPLPAGTLTLAGELKAGGYHTGMTGKWGLGAPHTESIPTQMGFDFFFGYNCQRQAHTYYPLHLYENEHRVYLNNDTVPPNTKLQEGADPYDMASYSKYNLTDYAPELMFREMSDFVERNQDHPFFLYWATPIPHVPLQAPQRWVDHYVEKFGDEKPYLGDKSYFPHRYPHAAYAAMISYLDENVGKLVQQLKDLGISENTLIIFSSDNGPSFNGGTDSPWFDSGGPFASEQGKGKGNVYEGGIRVPMIASWPGHIAPGTTTNHPSAFYDVFPTLCDVVGIDPPEATDGISFLPILLGKGEQQQHEFLYWEFPASGGQVAIRMGEWKVIWREMQSENPVLELYNLTDDPQETQNVADQHPEIVEKAEAILSQEHTAPALDRFEIAALQNQSVFQ
jgi:arylsulfatase